MSRLLFLAIDDLDGELLESFSSEGKLPNFTKLMESGIHGGISSTFPKVSAMMWNTALTGKRAKLHGVLSDHHFENDRPSQEVSSHSLRTKTIWNILSDAGIHTSAINFPASHPACDLSGTHLSNRFSESPENNPAEEPLLEGSVKSSINTERFKELRVVADDLDEGIAKTFIYDFDPNSEKQANLINLLSRGLVKIFSVQAATLEILQNDPWQCVGSYYNLLSELKVFSRCYKQDHEEAQCYRETYENCYRLIDLQIGELLKQVSPEDTVILMSCNGLTLPANIQSPPQASERGYLIVSGPNITTQQFLFGGIEDITPTILAHFNQPIANDMSGVILSSITKETGVFIESYEAHPTPENPLHTLEQLNRAIDSADHSDWESALHDLEAVYTYFPQHVGVHSLLSTAYIEVGDPQNAERVLLDLIRRTEDTAEVHFSLAKLHLDLKAPEKAYHHASVAMDMLDHPSPFDFLRFGQISNNLGKVPQAITLFEKAIDKDPYLAIAYQELARCYVTLKQYQEATTSASKAIELEVRSLNAYLYLAYSLSQLGAIKNAERVYLIALNIGSNDPEALMQISKFYSNIKKDAKTAEEILRKRDHVLLKKTSKPSELVLTKLPVYEPMDESKIFD